MRRKPRVHVFRTRPEDFASLKSGQRTFDLRVNTADIRPGDTAGYVEFDMTRAEETGFVEKRLIGHVMYGRAPGLEADYCILSLIKEAPG